MRQKRLLPFLLCAPLALAACGGGGPANSSANANGNAPTANASPAATTQPQATPRQQEVTATVGEATLAAGGSGEASITLDIREGYHVNANPASDRFYIPTEVRAEPQDGLTPGKPVYPKGVSRKFGFADAPLSVYDGRAVIKLPLRADKSMSKGRHTLRAKIRVQPCNDEACFPPREIDAAIPVTVN